MGINLEIQTLVINFLLNTTKRAKMHSGKRIMVALQLCKGDSRPQSLLDLRRNETLTEGI